jgi:hypothetical protein
MTYRTNYALMPCCWSSLARNSAGPASIRSKVRATRIAGGKSGGGEKRFYRGLIAKADERFDEHLSWTKKKER